MSVMDQSSQSLLRTAAQLQKIGDLTDEQCHDLVALPHRLLNAFPPRTLVREGAGIDDCCLLVSGYACRTKLTRRGHRQILSFHVAGDILNVERLLLDRTDHNVQVLSAATIAFIPIGELRKLMREDKAIGDAIWRYSLIEASVGREWLLNVGRRGALDRVAHMLCEFVARSHEAGLGEPQACPIPITQETMADATGLTSVHVNRMLKQLRLAGAIVGVGKELRVLDWDSLKRIAGFDPSYLCLGA